MIAYGVIVPRVKKDVWNSFSWMLGTVSVGCLEQFQLDALRAMCGAVRGIITIKSITKPGLFL